MLEIPLDKVAHVVLRSRELDVKVDSWEQDGSADLDDRDAETILEDRPDDGTRLELQEFLAGLNVDEQASLIALAWIGRGTYAPEELDEAIETARSEHGTNAVRYMLSLPLLPDYLQDAMDQLGLSAEEEERAMIRPEQTLDEGTQSSSREDADGAREALRAPRPKTV